ncbi:winged helix-turn-helix domain-containing protein [Marinicella sp. S1101]|uniref:winged helix-turn-helix domain-containing protein n=1 Tax=Marinicella marina TaxID=2996016 RepID=UPI002260B331|nr:winged helix-turn-helix domain-containing protein [Marinicella marina]MCX7553836.1 winged helix-turn-helix domain-containing protein [Marinicella marina]MDJ1140912.1 winged helix-turn-helix domain-containing protein [Marinicella marina]
MPSTARFWLTGDIRIDAVTQKSYHNHNEIQLSDLSFKTMKALINAFPEPLSNDDLIEQVWQHTAVSPETVTQRIALIRKAFNEVGLDAKTYIAATRHVGYRWLKPISQSNSKSTFKKVAISVFVCAFIGIGSWLYWSDQARPNLPIKATATVSAEDLSQQAWSYLDKHSAHSNQLAIGLFRQALAIDKDEVNALTGLSIALSHQVTKFNQDAKLLTEARERAQQATELTPSHAQAWAALAFVDDAAGDIDAAIAGYEKAIELAPKNTSTVSSLAYLYAVKGQLVDALQLNLSVLGSQQLYLDLQIAQVMNLLGFDVMAEQWYHKADVLGPDNVFATHQRAQFYLAQNQPSQAATVIEQAQQRGILRPELPTLQGLMAWKKSDIPLAINHFKTAQMIDESDMRSYLLLQALLGNDQQMQQHGWLSGTFSWPDQSVYQAQYYAVVGETDLAYQALSLAFDRGYRDHAWLTWSPAFEPLKTDDRWAELLLQIQADVAAQRQVILNADWLPTSFLNPKN